VAPFALLSYGDVRQRAALIATVTRKRYMPPWLPAAPRFQHESKLTDGEIALLSAWAAAGAPEGDPRLTPPAPVFSDGWTLGAPDLETAMSAPFTIPADGPDLYQCFVISAPAAENHWVRALDIRPGNPKVVHHAILFQDTSHTARRRDQGAGYPCFWNARVPARARTRRLDSGGRLRRSRKTSPTFSTGSRPGPADSLPPDRETGNRPDAPGALLHPAGAETPPDGCRAWLVAHRYTCRRARLQVTDHFTFHGGESIFWA
jgi:hypothetical protein